jgi:hypothetical protein
LAIALLGLGASIHAAPLKWKPYRPNTQQQLEQSSKPRTESETRKIKQVAAQAPADSDPLADPFEDGAKPLRRVAEDVVEDRFPLEPEPVQAEQEPAADSLKPTEDFFPGDPVPEMKRPPAERAEEPAEPKLPAADPVPALPDEGPEPQITEPSLSDEIRDPEYYDRPTDVTGCTSAKADCADELA